jgi:hypothetical protein
MSGGFFFELIKTFLGKLAGFSLYKGLAALAKHFGWGKVALFLLLLLSCALAVWYFWAQLRTSQTPTWLATAIVLLVSLGLILRTSFKILPQNRIGLIGVAGGDHYETGRLWKSALQYLSASKTIRYLGSTGEKSFAVDGSPLKGVFDDVATDVKIQILLIHPCSQFVEERVTDLQSKNKNPNGDIDDYKKEIHNALKYCRGLRKSGKNIEVRLYDRALVWKLIISDRCLWQQSYPPGRPSNESPANLFAEDGASSRKSAGMYEPFSRLFDMLFEASHAVDLLDSNATWWNTINCRDHLQSMRKSDFIGPQQPILRQDTTSITKGSARARASAQTRKPKSVKGVPTLRAK